MRAEKSVDFRIKLIVAAVQQRDGPGRTLADADPAAAAICGRDFRDVFGVDLRRIERAAADTGQTSHT